MILLMGRGESSLRFKVDLEGVVIGAYLGWELSTPCSVETPTPKQESAPPLRATVDLGQIHLAAVTTETGKSLVVSGRGIRTLKRNRNKAAGKIEKNKSDVLRIAS